MKKFMDKDFLLENKTAQTLYHDYAKDMPICDFHCHLNAKEIAEDKRYDNIGALWLGGDHYKWRVMRSNGIEEDYITGDQPDYEKFIKWAKTIPDAIGNPVYHWTHLELQFYFGIHQILSEKTADEIWNKCNEQLQKGPLTVRQMIRKSNVKVICTTDDPIDSLEYHQAIARDESFEVKVLPTFRPDKAINIDLSWFSDWVGKLAEVNGEPIHEVKDLLAALKNRMDWFEQNGCFISDHGLDVVMFEPATYEQAAVIFEKALNNQELTSFERQQYKGFLSVFLGKEYARRGWTMQLHMGALRNNASRKFKELGPDTGFDSIHDATLAVNLSKLLDTLDTTNELPKTILYCLNPRDNEVIATMMGNFQGGGIPGKIQFGSGWWFNDQKDGMEKQMEALSQLGLLSRFIGMVTDSRSFLSFTRHEYFRRILCNKIGKWVENGEYPLEMEHLGKIVQNICYHNAIRYFQLNTLS